MTFKAQSSSSTTVLANRVADSHVVANSYHAYQLFDSETFTWQQITLNSDSILINIYNTLTPLYSDDDINPEVRNMFTRTNVLIRRFGNCSLPVKLSLFKTYCWNLYDIALWHTYLKGSMQKLRSCYNRCVKMFFGYSRSYSMTQALLEMNMPSFDTLLFNSSARFRHCWKKLW